MIRSFGDKATEDIFEARDSKTARKALPYALHRIAKRKLNLIAAAFKLNDLKAPPGNRLQALDGDLKGLHSIRINDQWRIVFRWNRGNPTEVRIIDYH